MVQHRAVGWMGKNLDSIKFCELFFRHTRSEAWLRLDGTGHALCWLMLDTSLSAYRIRCRVVGNKILQFIARSLERIQSARFLQSSTIHTTWLFLQIDRGVGQTEVVGHVEPIVSGDYGWQGRSTSHQKSLSASKMDHPVGSWAACDRLRHFCFPVHG